MKRWRRRRRGELFLYISLTTVGMCKKPPLAFLEIGMDRVAQSGFSSLSSRESRICDERVERLRILDSQRLPFGASWTLLASLSSPHENREFMEGKAGSSEFSILRDCVFKSTLDASPCENRESVDRGLGCAELVILREDFSREGELLFHHSNLSSAIC